MSNPPEDIALWAAFKKGSSEAFDSLFRAYYPMLFQYGLRICDDREVLEDSIHDLFIELWQSNASTEVQSIKAYLLKALKFKLYKQFRRQVPKNELQDDIAFVVSHDNFISEREDQQATVQQLTDAINKLPNRQREIIYLRIYQLLSYEEISEVMHINYQAARNLFSQSIKSLRNILSA